MAQVVRKAYDSEAPTLFFHKARERWYILFHHPGTKKRQWKGTGCKLHEKAQAEEKLKQHVKVLGAESLGLTEIPTTEQAKTTIGQCLDLWAKYVEQEEHRSANGALTQLGAMREAWGAVRVANLTLGILNDARTAWRKMGYAKATINLRISYVRRACKLAKAHGIILRCPTYPVTSKNGKGDGWPMYDVSDNVREGVVSPEELARVNAAESESAVRDLNTFGFWTGMRWGGICGLTWDGFDPTTFALRLHPRSSKNKKGIVLRLPVGSQLHAVITRRLAERRLGCKWIFHVNGQNLLTARCRWARAWKRAGLDMKPAEPRVARGRKTSGRETPARVFHDMRRTGLTNLINSGVPEKVAMMISGHKTRAVFERYNIQGEAEAEQALATVSQRIGAVPEHAPVTLTPQARGWQGRARLTRRVVPLSAHTRPAPAPTPATPSRVSA